jgi:protein O-GlcNAc transferase
MTDKALYMPHSYFVSDYKKSFSDQLALIPGVTRARAGLPSEDEYPMVYCNFNRHRKFDPVIFRAWLVILKRVPQSVLWLLDFDMGKDRMRAIAQDAGIDPDRIVFVARYHQHEHLALKSICNLFLDNPVYNAHTTGTDTLWAGVPILTLPLDRMVSRVAASLITAIGCADNVGGSGLVAESLTGYVETAVRIGSDPALAARLRKCVVENRESAPLFDLPRWVADFEKLLQAAWEVDAAMGRGRTMHIA